MDARPAVQVAAEKESRSIRWNGGNFHFESRFVWTPLLSHASDSCTYDALISITEPTTRTHTCWRQPLGQRRDKYCTRNCRSPSSPIPKLLRPASRHRRLSLSAPHSPFPPGFLYSLLRFQVTTFLAGVQRLAFRSTNSRISWGMHNSIYAFPRK